MYSGMRRYVWIIVGIIALIAILFGGAAARLYTDWLWFSDLGPAYAGIFTKIIWTRIGLASVFGAIFFAIVYSNLWLARRLAPPPTGRYGGIEDELRQRFGALARSGLGLLLLGGTLVVALLVGLQAATHWNEWLKFTNATSFAVSGASAYRDPVFGADIGFYVFRLPLWNYLYEWFFFTILVAAIAAALLHYANEGIDYFANTPRFSPGVKTHLAVLVALLFFLKAAGYWLARYQLVTSPGDLFYGVGYTDIHARLPALWILMVAAVIGGGLVLANIRRSGIWLATGALAGLVLLSIIVGSVYPAIIEQFSVEPNQLEKQTPYIRQAIKYTRQAFQVDKVASRPFQYVLNLTPDQIARNQAAVQNLRLWDYGPLQRVYNQVQVFQQYYEFQDVDIDRYTIDGRYRQVMLSARELTGPPENSQTWVNRFLRYTHGYGYVMSPVNVVAQEGLPDYFVQGIPPVTQNGLKLNVPQIYFGEDPGGYVLVNTRQKEFDYLVGDQNRENRYGAKSGPTIGTFFRKLAFAIRFGDINILLSDDLRPSSRVLFRRNVAERVQTLFPFLRFDNDPYLVTVGGRLYWFHDAYTTADRYPYSEHVAFEFGDAAADVSYVRNSVKLVTDAYTGKVEAFVFDPNDPIIRTYQRMFPGVFKPISAMPDDFRKHIRYPEDLFKIQATAYSKYHMTEPSAFYSGVDLWQIPTMQVTPDGESTGLEPYYVITRLPNSSVDEFILIVPLVRAKRENMVAWMAAKCDSPDYGKLIVYEFPRGETIFGPSQIMARANQDTNISQQFTLWNQVGSTVVRGKLLAIPIENSILYVEPIYLESTTTKIPEFKRVIVALGGRIVMESTLERALAQVVGVTNLPVVASTAAPTTGAVAPPSGAQPPPPQPAPVAASPEVQDLAKRAAGQIKAAEDAQKRSDWAEYGKQLDALKKTLSELQKRAGG